MKAHVATHLGFLIEENIGLVLQTFINTLGVWLEERAQASGGQIDKDKLAGQYEGYVDRTLAAGHYTRIDAPDTLLPPMSWAKVDELTAILSDALRSLPVEEVLPFLGELTGAWILSCPASLIRQYSQDPRPMATEADLIFLMRLWLARALMVGR